MNVALIVAAGQGTRMGVPGGKQMMMLMGKPVLAHTLIAFEQAGFIDVVVVVTTTENIDKVRELVEMFDCEKVRQIVEGGVQRQDSVRLGLQALGSLGDVEYVAVHDGARPLIEPGLIDAALAGIGESDGVVVGIPAKDTIKLVRDGFVTRTLNRAEAWQAQTPQVFAFKSLLEAHQKALDDGFYGTDDAMLLEHYGGRIKLIAGSETNIKITTPSDILVAETILRARET